MVCIIKQYLYQKLAHRLKDNIHNGVWQAGEKLPSIRHLCEQHSLSKISVQKALYELEAMGLIFAKPRSGYYVENQQKLSIENKFNLSHTDSSNKPSLIKVPELFHDIMRLSAAFDIFPSSKVESPVPSIKLLHRNISRAMREQEHSQTLYYGDPSGDSELKKHLTQHYRGRNVLIDSSDICITAGCQNSLFLALSSTCQAGDTIAIESPAFYGVLQLAQSLHLKVIEISASTSQGINIEKLSVSLQTWPIKACIVTSSFATPTGACMPLNAKQALLKLASQYHFTIIEDDIYGDLGFHITPEPIKALDTEGNTILCSSFSKSLSRDLRIGWVMGGQAHQHIVHTKLVHQLSGNQSQQQGLANFIAKGDFRRHLILYRQQLKNQRDSLLNTINQHWRFPFSYTVPDGGLAIWINLDKKIDTISLYNEAQKQNIVLTPGALFSTQARYKNCLRLSFVHPIEEQRTLALIKVNQLICKILEQG